MKKLLALILALAMVITLAVPGAAATSRSIRINWAAPSSGGGLFGKGAAEYAKAAVTDASGEAKAVLVTASSPEYDFSDKKYIVLDINVAPNSNATHISVGPNAGLFALESTAFTADRWNNVRVVVEVKTAEELMKLGTYQPMTLYINGVKAAEGAHEIHETDELSGTEGKTAAYGKGFRVNIHGDKSTAVGYAADCSIFTSDENKAPVMPVLNGGADFAVNSDGTITFDDAATVTLGDIKAANPDVAVTAFVNDSFDTAVNENSMLVKGNMLVVKSADNLYSYYTVASGSYGENILKSIADYADFDLGVINGEKSEATGVGGKAESDSSIWIKPGTSADGETGFGYTAKAAAGYLVYEYSILSTDCTAVRFTTDAGTAITDNYADFITGKVWNRVKLVMDCTDNNTTKSMVYINGVSTSDVWKEIAAYNSGSICLRIKGNAYVDDISIYRAKFVRPPETAAIGDGAGYDVDGSSIIVPYGGCVAPDSIVHDGKYIVKAFDADVSEQVGAITPGCIVTVEGKSIAAQDMGYAYNDLYACYNVIEAEERYQLVTSNPDFTANNGTCKAVTSPVLGNNSGNVKKVELGSTNNFCQHTWATANPGAQYLVYSVNIAPVPGDNAITGIRFGTDGHSAISSTAQVGRHLLENAWNSVVMVYDIHSNKSDLYVNGEAISTGFASAYIKGTSSALRCIIEGAAGAVCYVDNVYVYESSVVPTVPRSDKLADGYTGRILVNNDNATADINKALTVADAAAAAKADSTVTVYADSTYTTVLDSNDTFNEGAVLVIKSADNVYTTYTVTIHGSDIIIADGDTYDGAGNMTTGTIGLYAPVTNGGTLLAAQYDEDGNIIKIAVDTTPHNNTLEIAFETEEVDKTKIKAMLVDSRNVTKMVCEPVEINVRDYINFLILGNSYSMDVTWHLRQIAAADDVLMNVHVLNKGGCHLNYHYDNRQGDPVKLGVNFWENNKSLGRLYNLEQVLEKFDWDYIAIQASSTTQGLDDTSDANYEKNWSVAVPFAEYLHEMEPDARLVIHSTWSMENGYSFVDSAATRDRIMANMRTLNNRCAEDINKALGLAGDEQVLIISSTDIIDAARAYAPSQDITINGRTCPAGTRIFDTAYYKPGHVFTFTRANARDVAVGDGAMLLSDADRLAGKISLHRDGFHMSAVGRYLVALNAYATITGNKVSGNTFDSADATRADGTIFLDSSPGGLHVTETDTNTSDTVYQIYDILTPEIRDLCQQLVDNDI